MDISKELEIVRVVPELLPAQPAPAPEPRPKTVLVPEEVPEELVPA